HPAQILVLSERRGAGETLRRACRQSISALEVEPDGSSIHEQVGGVLQGQGRNVPSHRHQTGPLVDRRGRRQATGPAQLYRSRSELSPLQRRDSAGAQTSQAEETEER